MIEVWVDVSTSLMFMAVVIIAIAVFFIGGLGGGASLFKPESKSDKIFSGVLFSSPLLVWLWPLLAVMLVLGVVAAPFFGLWTLYRAFAERNEE